MSLFRDIFMALMSNAQETKRVIEQLLGLCSVSQGNRVTSLLFRFAFIKTQFFYALDEQCIGDKTSHRTITRII